MLLALVFGISLLPAVGRAQTYTILHAFTGQSDGANPVAGVTTDQIGNLYGTTSAGGEEGFGNVYRLVRSDSTWSFYLLYPFQGFTQRSQDGGSPHSRAVIGPDGALYGTTRIGGNGDNGGGCREEHGCGSVYRLQPQFGGGWKETVLYQFGYYDGENPFYGDVVFDQAGNLYGATRNGGANSQGAIFKLTPGNGGWTESVIHSFSGSDGSAPLGGPAIDSAGNLYGTTSLGGAGGYGVIYGLQPTSSDWVGTVLHSFQGSDGVTPASAVVLDQSANVYGATQAGGVGGDGSAFKLTLGADGLWDLTTLVGFKGAGIQGSYRTLAMDRMGDLYGTTATEGAYHLGSVFKLTFANGTWLCTTLHDFTGGGDGANPYGTLSFDASGNIYGTAENGGTYGNGVVFQISQ